MLSKSLLMPTRNEDNSLSNNKQSSFAGTNPDVYGDPQPANAQDNPIQDQEAQNVADSQERLQDKEAEKARTKANEGKGEENASRTTD
jgi:hypothetical protein